MPRTAVYSTEIGLGIRREATPLLDPSASIVALARQLDTHRGVLLTSNFEYPGRYTRWDVGFIDPPLSLSGHGSQARLEAHNERGEVLLAACKAALGRCPNVTVHIVEPRHIVCEVSPDETPFTEEQRTRRPSLMTVVRCLREAFACPNERHLGFYGAFGYDMAFQFESLVQRMPRRVGQRDLVLMLPDRLLVIDHHRGTAFIVAYEFSFLDRDTAELSSESATSPYVAGAGPQKAKSDHPPGAYAALVRKALAEFAAGNLFEVVPAQEFTKVCSTPPSQVFATLRRDNPAPYGFLINLGKNEYLVGASPEMFVRVRGDRVESCPIAGTIARGQDALADADQIRTLLNSEKDAAELTMCTDVDRNDKARVCEPGSVRVIGRRQVELYARLIHTVDHLEGKLRPQFDGLDGMVAHAWAVTVTGAPKQAAMQFIEDHERSPREFYGGAIGVVGLDGTINTGLALRTMHIRGGVAHIRAGATLLYASDPQAETCETELKASALLAALAQGGDRALPARAQPTAQRPARARRRGPRVLLIDHRDSFVHTLGDYFRQLDARVTTLRAGFPLEQVDALDPQLVVLSPGPGRPADFSLTETFARLAATRRPAFGVCLGLQGLVEFAGGQLGVLPVPRHGAQSTLCAVGGPMFDSLPARGLSVGRYHSLHALRATLPPTLRVDAEADDDGCVMACAHRELPFLAVQFHPESIMSTGRGMGLTLLSNVLATLCA